MTAPAGVIYFTTNGLDPRLPGGSLSRDARLYVSALAISSSQQILARAWRTNSWSALTVSSFTFSNLAPALAVSVSGSAAVLSWVADAREFVLEAADSLSAPQWKLVNGVVNNSVTVDMTGGSRFYRLRRP
jgi:capsid protein